MKEFVGWEVKCTKVGVSGCLGLNWMDLILWEWCVLILLGGVSNFALFFFSINYFVFNLII